MRLGWEHCMPVNTTTLSGRMDSILPSSICTLRYHLEGRWAMVAISAKKTCLVKGSSRSTTLGMDPTESTSSTATATLSTWIALDEPLAGVSITLELDSPSLLRALLRVTRAGSAPVPAPAPKPAPSLLLLLLPSSLLTLLVEGEFSLSVRLPASQRTFSPLALIFSHTSSSFITTSTSFGSKEVRIFEALMSACSFMRLCRGAMCTEGVGRGIRQSRMVS
mmetsp:Transcript_10601/g.23527  ORF Transcript_10601/g.23527 Transcript_10601/m.23527 type:complete len:221 (-) Transcript_10601:969-1631(-)